MAVRDTPWTPLYDKLKAVGLGTTKFSELALYATISSEQYPILPGEWLMRLITTPICP